MLQHGGIRLIISLKGNDIYARFIISFQGFVFYTPERIFYYGYASPQWVRLYH